MARDTQIYIPFIQAAMVFVVLAATIYMAVTNNNTEIIYNLVTLIFGYYFGVQNSTPPPKNPA